MLKNYLKIAWRNVVRNKAFSAINVAGLSIGIAASLIIFTIVNYELSYDKFQPGYKRIYRIVTQDKYADGYTYNPGVPGAAIEALRSKMPEISFAPIYSIYESQVTVNASENTSTNKKFIEKDGIFFCGANLFQVFNYTWMAGSASVLNEPNTVVLSKNVAEKYFGNWQQAINKTITLDNTILLRVAGILQDVPYNSDFPLSVLASFPTLKNNGEKYYYNNDWNTLSSNLQVYALLPENVSKTTLSDRLNNFSKEHYTGRGASLRTNSAQPLSDFHFNKRYDVFGDHTTSISTLWTLSLIGIFIINYEL